MDAAHVIQRHRLAKRVIERTVGSERERELLKSAGKITAVQISAREVGENGGLLLSIIKRSEEIERFLEVIDGFPRFPPIFEMAAQIVERNALTPWVAHQFGLTKLVCKLLKTGLGVRQLEIL